MFVIPNSQIIPSPKIQPEGAPSVDLLVMETPVVDTTPAALKPTIGVRKIQPRKTTVRIFKNILKTNKLKIIEIFSWAEPGKAV